MSPSAGGSPVRSNVTRRSSVSRSGLGRRFPGVRLEPRLHEVVDRVADPLGAGHRRHRRPLGRDERPVRLPLGPLVDPELQRLDLFRIEGVLVGARHDRRVEAQPVGACARGRRRRSPGGSAGCRQRSPGTMTGPPNEPRSEKGPSATSRRRPRCRASASGPWQVKQFSERIGRTSRAKSIVRSGKAGTSAAASSSPHSAPPSIQRRTASI